MTPEPIPLARPDIGEEEISAVVGVLRSGSLSLGPKLPEFEAAMAATCGTPHAVAVSSGTAALHLALIALGIGPGDDVVVPSFTFVATANAVRYVGARPVFADIDPTTYNLDPKDVERALTPRTRAIIVVHVFGRPAPMDPILALARRHRLLVVEDACEALGATSDGRPIGSLGAAAVFGFYPNKIITTGEGGVLVTADDGVAARVRRLRNQGRNPALPQGFDHTELGYNFRLSEMACALGIAQLQRLGTFINARQAVAERYDSLLGNVDVIRPPLGSGLDTIAWFVYVIRLQDHRSASDRERVLMLLREQGVGCARYFVPVHRQPLYRDGGGAPLHLPHTDQAGDRCLALPFHNRLSEPEQRRVADALRSALATLDQVP